MKFSIFLFGVFLMGFLGVAKSAVAETIVLEKTVPVSVEAAWKKWTEVNELKSWLANDANIELTF